jgi:hypothetical protein
MERLSFKHLAVAAITVGVVLALVNNAWVLVFTNASGFSVPQMINPFSVTMMSVIPMLVAAVAVFLLQRAGARGLRLYMIGTVVLGLLSTWGSFTVPMPDGSATPLNFTILSVPMHLTAIVAAVMIPRRAAKRAQG